MRKIFIFNPPKVEGLCVTREESTYGKTNLNVSPYDILILSSLFKKEGYNVMLYDCQSPSSDMSEFFSLLSKTEPDWIITQSTFASYKQDFNLFNAIKKDINTKIICNFNPSLNFNLVKTLFSQYNKCVDYLVLDEPYYTPFELIHKNKIDGVAYTKNNNLIYNRKKNFININELPIPDFDSIGISRYDAIYLNSMRDCIFRCIFCTHSQSNRLFKQRGYYSSERLLDEVKLIYNLGGKRIYLSDTNPFLATQRLKEFCEGIIKNRIDIKWECNGRVKTLDYKIMDLMKKAGCTSIVLGIESGSDEMLKNMKKDITIEDSIEDIKILKKLKMPTSYHLLIGLPGETKKTINDTIVLINKTKPDNFSVNIATPFPGTEFYDYCIKNGLCSESDFFSKKFDHRTGQLIKSDLDLNREKREIFRKTMFTPWYIKSKIKKYLNSESQDGVFGMSKRGFRLILNMYRRSF